MQIHINVFFVPLPNWHNQQIKMRVHQYNNYSLCRHAHACTYMFRTVAKYIFWPMLFLSRRCHAPKQRQIMASKKVSNRFLFTIHAVLICSAFFLRVRGHGDENGNGDGYGRVPCAYASMTFNVFLLFLFYAYPAFSVFFRNMHLL